MACGRFYAHLQILWIRTGFEHLLVIISFNDEIVRFTNVFLHLFCNMSYISHKTEGQSFFYSVIHLYAITNIATAVMRNSKWCNIEVTKLYSNILLNDLLMDSRYLLWNTVVTQNTSMHIAGGIDGDIIFCADYPHRFYVIGMVVGYEYSLDTVNADALVVKEFLYIPYPDTCIYQHSITILFKIITISTAPTAEGYEFQHF